MFRESSYCFKVVNATKTWENARNDCANDNGHLACYHNYTEIEVLSKRCKDCWLGYFWKNGRFMLISLLVYFSEYHSGKISLDDI